TQDALGGRTPKWEGGPCPAFPADLTSIALAVATQARGTILIFEKMFENRLFFVDKLVSMGARIILCDPHRAVVSGPTKLYGQRMSSPDIRAGMALLIASLCAEGTSTIGNVSEIDRGCGRPARRWAASRPRAPRGPQRRRRPRRSRRPERGGRRGSRSARGRGRPAPRSVRGSPPRRARPRRRPRARRTRSRSRTGTRR